ncbi:hypothetical protein NAT51_08060 [Flavobacterium amniphilum]|uniref:hypothetical protein n=1 Tax=Flavobacterium amniphilum TaxID=1834035 RepID=UPI002029B4B3|nr:hypothetical protein [Flavobacterium amniphilum]MCL9805472.1 hypothetical protein [Flavobacterium amniphilum]
MILKNLILKIWLWIIFLISKDELPKKSKIINPKMEYEIMSGAIFWEDEGLSELRNHRLLDAFKYVINHRMKLIVGPENDVGFMRSYSFDKQIFKMAKRFYPEWIGLDESRCSYNQESADRIMRIKKVSRWKLEKFFNEE